MPPSICRGELPGSTIPEPSPQGIPQLPGGSGTASCPPFHGRTTLPGRFLLPFPPRLPSGIAQQRHSQPEALPEALSAARAGSWDAHGALFPVLEPRCHHALPHADGTNARSTKIHGSTKRRLEHDRTQGTRSYFGSRNCCGEGGQAPNGVSEEHKRPALPNAEPGALQRPGGDPR